MKTCARPSCNNPVIPPRKYFCSDLCGAKTHAMRYRAEKRGAKVTKDPRDWPTRRAAIIAAHGVRFETKVTMYNTMRSWIAEKVA